MVRNRGYPAAGLLFLFTSLASSAFRYPDRFAVLDDAAFVPDFGPRWYMKAVPALPALAKRQDDGVRSCPTGQHGCLELGPMGAEACCLNSQYCVRDTNWQPKCCALGSICDLPCDEDRVLCNATTTSTVTLSTTMAVGGATDSPSVTLTVVPTDIPVLGCCNRPCSSSSFLCQSLFGGQCCPYGAACATGGNCLIGPTTTPLSTIVTPVPSGCTTSQITCTDGGCCNTGSTCTWQQMENTMSPVCAPNITVTDNGDGGLSAQARAGIGAGVAVAAAIIIGLLTWFCLRRRSARSRSGGGSSGAAAATAATAGMGAGGAGAVGMRYMGRDNDGEDSLSLVSPYIRRPATLSDSTAPASRLEHDYFGPDAVPGPFTEDANVPPAPALSPGGRDGGVPLQPMDPNDIVPPIEIDSRIRGLSIGSRSGEVERDMMIAGQGSKGAKGATPARDEEPEQVLGPFELYGSPGSPPLSPDYFPRQGPPPAPGTEPKGRLADWNSNKHS
ncbi:hypothetical protein F5X99DRAFT_147504 [Biscogniauxia marginata]|nr:hypothetical protein F5X99DRAFT_147504 [Biscogniauxia marginata]